MSKAQAIHEEKQSIINKITELKTAYVKAIYDYSKQRIDGQKLQSEASRLLSGIEKLKQTGQEVTEGTKANQRNMAKEAIKILECAADNDKLQVRLNSEIYELEIQMQAWQPSIEVDAKDLEASLQSLTETKEVIDKIITTIAEIGAVNASGYIPVLADLNEQRGLLSADVALGIKPIPELVALDLKIKETEELVREDNKLIAQKQSTINALNSKLDAERNTLETKQDQHDTVFYSYLLARTEIKAIEYAKRAKQLSAIDCDLRAANELLNRRVIGSLSYPTYNLKALHGIDLHGDLPAAKKKLEDLRKQMGA